MRTWDGLIFFAIACFLGIIAARAIMPVEAAKEQVLKIDIVKIGGSTYTVGDLTRRIRKR